MSTDKTTRPHQGSDKYIVRFPDGMRERIAEAAKANNRSMNSEIIARLEASFEPPEASIAVLTKIMEEREARMLEEVSANVRRLLEEAENRRAK